MYERTSAEQQEAVSKIMMSTEKTTFDEKLKENRPSKRDRTLDSKQTQRTLACDLGGIFRDISHNSIGSLTINIGQPQQSVTKREPSDSEEYDDQEFDALSQSLDLNIT